MLRQRLRSLPQLLRALCLGKCGSTNHRQLNYHYVALVLAHMSKAPHESHIYIQPASNSHQLLMKQVNQAWMQWYAIAGSMRQQYQARHGPERA